MLSQLGCRLPKRTRRPCGLQDKRKRCALLTRFPRSARLTHSPGPTTIFARVGMSFISTDQACQNAESEIPSFDFEGTRAAVRAEWNELLGRVQVETQGVDDDTVELFYSSLYRTHISPADCECSHRALYTRQYAAAKLLSRHGREPIVAVRRAVLRFVLLQRKRAQ